MGERRSLPEEQGTLPTAVEIGFFLVAALLVAAGLLSASWYLLLLGGALFIITLNPGIFIWSVEKLLAAAQNNDTRSLLPRIAGAFFFISIALLFFGFAVFGVPLLVLDILLAIVAWSDTFELRPETIGASTAVPAQSGAVEIARLPAELLEPIRALLPPNTHSIAPAQLRALYAQATALMAERKRYVEHEREGLERQLELKRAEARAAYTASFSAEERALLEFKLRAKADAEARAAADCERMEQQISALLDALSKKADTPKLSGPASGRISPAVIAEWGQSSIVRK